MNEIQELGTGLRKYRTEIPNLVLDLGLTVYELALYVHLKRTAGDDGESWKSTKTLVKETGMSAGSIVNAKKGLTTKELIEISQQAHKSGTDYIKIVPIWEINFRHFCAERSPSEQERSPSETKNNFIKKDIKKGDILDGMIFYSREADKLEGCPPLHAELMRPFCEFYRYPYKDELKAWIAQVDTWLSRGYGVKDVEKACQYVLVNKWEYFQPSSILKAFGKKLKTNSKQEYDAVAERAKSEAKHE